MSEILVDVSGLSRKFGTSYAVSQKNGFKQILHNFWGQAWREGELLGGERWALQSISFTLSRGESIGLLGVNGAGKSTLLKAIAGLLLPSAGSIRVNGRVESMIELSAGFEVRLTGRQNVYRKCALGGMSKSEAQAVVEEVVDFAELDDYIDSPVSYYSSGMVSRLAFAAAVLRNPDILLIDEVLSVGDFNFRQKCLSKMNDIRPHCGVLFVSHSLDAVRMFCDRGIVIDSGKVLYDSPVEEAVDFYYDYLETRSKASEGKIVKKNVPKRIQDALGPQMFNKEKVTSLEYSWKGPSGEKELRYGQPIVLTAKCTMSFAPRNLLVGLPLFDELGQRLVVFNSDADGMKFDVKEGSVSFELEIAPFFTAGTYYPVFCLCDGNEFLARQHMPALEIVGGGARAMGDFLVAHQWRTDNSIGDE